MAAPLMTKGMTPPNKGKTYPPEVLTPSEVAAIIGQCSAKAPAGVRNRALLTMLYRSGLRVSEALALRVTDVNLTAHTVRVLHGKGDTATTRGFHPSATDALARWTDTRKALGICTGTLFCTLQGGPLSAQYVRNLLHRLGGRAGIDKRVHPHGLRHIFAVELEVSNVATSASFSGSRERGLPAAQRAPWDALSAAEGRGSARDLGCHQPVAPGARIRHLIRLQEVTACCGQPNIQERSEDRGSIRPIAG